MSSIKGDINMMPITDVIAWIGSCKLTCTLSIHRGPLVSSFTIRQGAVWQSHSNDPREYLGQHLINFGYIDETDLAKAFTTQTETNVPLGRVLVMVDALTQLQLERVLLFKTRESLLEAICRADGGFKVQNHILEDREFDCPVPIDLLEVHSEGRARNRLWKEFRKVFPSDATRCEILAGAEDMVQSVFDRRLLELLTRKKSIGEAGLELRAMDFQLYARLYDLFHRMLIRPKLTTEIIEKSGELVDSPRFTRLDTPQGQKPRYRVLRAETPPEKSDVEIPQEAVDPRAALKIALSGRNWNRAFLLAERLLEIYPEDEEASQARQIASAQINGSHGPQQSQDLSPDSIPVIVGSPDSIATAHLTSKERYVLSRMDGSRTLMEIASVIPIQESDFYRIVSAFIRRGIVKVAS